MKPAMAIRWNWPLLGRGFSVMSTLAMLERSQLKPQGRRGPLQSVLSPWSLRENISAASLTLRQGILGKLNEIAVLP